MSDPFAEHTWSGTDQRDLCSRDELIERVRREFQGLAGLRLTLAQTARLLNLERKRCERL